MAGQKRQHPLIGAWWTSRSVTGRHFYGQFHDKDDNITNRFLCQSQVAGQIRYAIHSVLGNYNCGLAATYHVTQCGDTRAGPVILSDIFLLNFDMRMLPVMLSCNLLHHLCGGAIAGEAMQSQ